MRERLSKLRSTRMGRVPNTSCDGSSRDKDQAKVESLLFSYNPAGAVSVRKRKSWDPSGSGQALQEMRCFKLDSSKHKIFLSHSGAQKDFVEHVCEDLVRHGYLFPFLDRRWDSLPKGKDFVPLILEAAQQCHVAAIVLSEEFLSSKWPMIELASFHAAQAENRQLNMLPLYFKLSIDDLDDRSVENRWMPIWKKHAGDDERIDVNKWHAAVRALRRVNGLVFENYGMSEVAYKKGVVECIFKLSPPDLLNGSCKVVVGYDRLCQTISRQFVKDSKTGGLLLGLYGMSGVGKTTLSKALCDQFYGEYLGRVCHVELGDVSRALERLKWVLHQLCGIEKVVLDRIRDVGQGWNLIQEHMKGEPIFLVIDNVGDDESSRKEALAYLTVGFHPMSRIMITSRSRYIVQDLHPELEFCFPMPHLTEEEAGAIFLRSAAPRKSISLLTHEERTILGQCIKRCQFQNSGPTYDESYHPLALSALGDFCCRISSSCMLSWKECLEDNKELVKDILRCSNMFDILQLQFSSFQPREQLLFLDIALYGDDLEVLKIIPENMFQWLLDLHEDTKASMVLKLQDLRRSGVINLYSWLVGGSIWFIRVHDLYKEFAKWYVREWDQGWLKNVWCAYQRAATNLSPTKRLKRPSFSKCWIDLVRLRILGFPHGYFPRIVGKTIQDLENLVLLQLHCCLELIELNLEGLYRLHHLELSELPKLVTITLSTRKGVGMYQSLQWVLLEDLNSLEYVPDFTSCTSLRYFAILGCFSLRSLEGIQCSSLRELVLYVSPCQLERLNSLESLNFKSLSSLVSFDISDVDEVGTAYSDDEVDALDLSGLECCNHLCELKLSCRSVKSFLGLAQLTNLENLHLYWRHPFLQIPGLSENCPLGRAYNESKDETGRLNEIFARSYYYYPLRDGYGFARGYFVNLLQEDEEEEEVEEEVEEEEEG